MTELNKEETISMLLYLCEDLKTKVFNGEKFEPFQLPTLNSIIECVEKQNNVQTMDSKEFNQITIHAVEKKLTWNR